MVIEHFAALYCPGPAKYFSLSQPDTKLIYKIETQTTLARHSGNFKTTDQNYNISFYTRAANPSFSLGVKHFLSSSEKMFSGLKLLHYVVIKSTF